MGDSVAVTADSSRPAHRVVRFLGSVAVVAFLWAGCTRSGDEASKPAATATRPPAHTPTVAVRPTAVPTAQPKEAVAPTAAGATEAGFPHSNCERFVAVLSGRAQEPALLEKPEVQWLAQEAPDLVTCGALVRDSADLCKLVSQWRACPDCPITGGQPKNKRQSKGDDCYSMWAVFHELRTNPKNRAFMLDECAAPDHVWAQFCTAMTAALRSGDVHQCDALAKGQGMCQALITLDPASCRPEAGIPDDWPSACQTRIRSRAFLGKGLKAIAEAGVPASPDTTAEFGDLTRIQEFAKAALGQADACDTFAKAAMDKCKASTFTAPPPTIEVTPPDTPIPTAAPAGDTETQRS